MTVFDVYVNGRKRCRAGVGLDGVLTAIVDWVKLTGPAARRARQLRQPLEEARLHVGGLRGGTHQSWVEQRLDDGDRVVVELAKSTRRDAPRVRRTSRPRAPIRPEQTRFLNVDLDITSRLPLDRLVNAFGRDIFVLHAGRDGRKHVAHLEAEPSGDADALIRRLVAAVQRLPRAERRMWDRAEVREFNVGVQAEAQPAAYEWRLSPRTVSDAASVNAGIAVTVYAPVK